MGRLAGLLLIVAALSGILGAAGCAGQPGERRHWEMVKRDLTVAQTDIDFLTATGVVGQAQLVAGKAGGREEGPQAPKAPTRDPAQLERLVIYNAELYVVVSSVADSLKRMNDLASGMGGYMQEMSAQAITLKVPADRFQEAISAVEKLGEVTKKDIKGTDVTEEMRDLSIRLQNQEKVRDQLAKLLDKCDKVEDALKVEKELERVTQEMELLKGKIQYLQHSITFSTITVHLNSRVPQQRAAVAVQFDWVSELANELIAGSPRVVYTGRNWGRRVRFDLPKDYVKYYERDYTTRARSAEGVMIVVSRHKNYEGGNLTFWHKLIRRELVEQKAIAVGEEVAVKLTRKEGAQMIIGAKEIAGKPHGYLVAVAATEDYVYVFQAWGPADKFTEDRPKLEAAAKSIRIPWIE